jgi:hypothetical protein
MHTRTMGAVGDKLTHDTVNPDTTCTDVVPVLMYNGCGHGVCDDAVGSKVTNRRAHPVTTCAIAPCEFSPEKKYALEFYDFFFDYSHVKQMKLYPTLGCFMHLPHCYHTI